METATVQTAAERFGYHIAHRPASWLVGMVQSGPHASGRVWVRAFWRRFLAVADTLPGDLDRTVYLCPAHGRETEFTYYLGYEAAVPIDLAGRDDLVQIALPAHDYAVAHVVGDQDAVDAAYAGLPQWARTQGREVNREILWLERIPGPPGPIGEAMDFEIWLPLR